MGKRSGGQFRSGLRARGLLVAALGVAWIVQLSACGGGGSGGPGRGGAPGGIGPGGTGAGGAAGPPLTCGDGVHQPGEACDSERDCGLSARCTASCTCTPLAPPPPTTSQVLIDTDYRTGTIDEFHWLLYRAYALYDDPRLPPAYDGVGPMREDMALALDLRDAAGRLDAAQNAALAPFVVRPSDPGSVFSLGYQTPLGAAASFAASGTAAPLLAAGAADPCATASACPAWASDASAHFRVWSCGEALGAVRASVLALAEPIYGPMTAYMGEPVPDDADNDGGPAKTDIYIVEPNQARLRGGACKTIPGGASARTVAAPMFLGQGSRSEISSGYILLSAAAAQDAGARSTIIHELFHILQLAYTTNTTSWLTESTAVWAEWHFDPADAPDQVFWRFPEEPATKGGFLARVREPLDLNVVFGGFASSYDAFIWHYFAEQETGVDSVARLWRGIAAGGRPGGYNAYVDAVTPFATNFRKFVVRNINQDPVKDAGLPTYYDDRSRNFPQPTTVSATGELGLLAAGSSLPIEVSIPRLAAEYAHFNVDPQVRELTFDFSGVGAPKQFTADLLLSTTPAGISGWKHVTVNGPKVTFCWDGVKGMDEPVYEVHLAMGNHGWQQEAPVAGAATVVGKTSCCSPGDPKCAWTGTIRLESTLMRHYVDPSRGTTEDSREHIVQTWTLETTMSADPVYFPSSDYVTGTWQAQLDYMTSMDHEGACTDTETAHGTMTKPFHFVFPRMGPPYYFERDLVNEMLNVVQFPTTGYNCESGTATTGVHSVLEDAVWLFAPPNGLQPTAGGDPTLFSGTAVVDHTEMNTSPDDMDLIDHQVTWSIHHNP